MKYRVILLKNDAGGGSPDGMTAVSFYTFNQALSCATLWNAASGGNSAWFWDGTEWRVYV